MFVHQINLNAFRDILTAFYLTQSRQLSCVGMCLSYMEKILNASFSGNVELFLNVIG